MRTTALPGLALAGLAAFGAAAGPLELVEADPPEALERWLYNPRERTATGVEALRAGRGRDALAALDAAARLAPDDPRTLYGAGSARLLMEQQTEHAIELLSEAAASAPPDLAPHAFYNLGNARLSADDAEGAVEAYREALRRAPNLRPAKHNLELALRRLERQEPGARPPREQPDGEERHEEERSGGREDGDTDDGRSGANPPPPAGTDLPGTLPSHFDAQADMTATQAAALLEAIDDLERRRRRAEARERGGEKRRGEGKDW